MAFLGGLDAAPVDSADESERLHPVAVDTKLYGVVVAIVVGECHFGVFVVE